MEATDLTDAQKKGMLVFLYLYQIRDLALIEADLFNLTPSGLDVSMDLYESGYRVNKYDMEIFLREITKDLSKELSDEDITMIVALMFAIQTDGYEKTKKLVGEMNKKV